MASRLSGRVLTPRVPSVLASEEASVRLLRPAAQQVRSLVVVASPQTVESTRPLLLKAMPVVLAAQQLEQLHLQSLVVPSILSPLLSIMTRSLADVPLVLHRVVKAGQSVGLPRL